MKMYNKIGASYVKDTLGEMQSSVFRLSKNPGWSFTEREKKKKITIWDLKGSLCCIKRQKAQYF